MPSMLKAEIYQPGELHAAIVDYYRSQIAMGDASDVVVTGYQDFVAADAAVRQVLVEVGKATGGDLQPDGRIAQQFECLLYAVVSKSVSDAAVQSMNLASALARHLPHNSFGFTARAVESPDRIELAESFLIRGSGDHSGFEAWEVRWSQQLNLSDPHGAEVDDPVLTGIWLAVNPADPDDIAEYSEVADKCLISSIAESVS